MRGLRPAFSIPPDYHRSEQKSGQARVHGEAVVGWFPGFESSASPISSVQSRAGHTWDFGIGCNDNRRSGASADSSFLRWAICTMDNSPFFDRQTCRNEESAEAPL